MTWSQSSTFPKPARIGVSQGDSLQIVGDQNNVLGKAVLLFNFRLRFDSGPRM